MRWRLLTILISLLKCLLLFNDGSQCDLLSIHVGLISTNILIIILLEERIILEFIVMWLDGVYPARILIYFLFERRLIVLICNLNIFVFVIKVHF